MDALEIRDGRSPLFNRNPRFGYGRTLSFLLLIPGGPDLWGLTVRRAVVQAAIVPAVWAAARLLGAGRLASLGGCLLVAVSQDLLTSLRCGHEGYLAPEWGAVALLGFALLATGRRWPGAALLGPGLAMAAMNHPFAGVLAVLLVPLALRHGGRNERLRAPTLVALGLALLVALPHLAVVVGVGWSELARPGGQAAIGLSGALTGYLPPFRDPGAAALVLAPLAALLLNPAAGRRLPAAILAAFGLGVLVAAATVGPAPWYWRPLIPACGVCAALALQGLGDRRWSTRWLPGAGAALLVGVAIASAVPQLTQRDVPRWSLWRPQVTRTLAAHLDVDGRPWEVVGYGYPAGERRPEALVFTLDAVLGGAPERLARPEQMGSSPVLVQLEGRGTWVTAVLTADLPPGVVPLGAGPGGASFAAEDAAAARALGRIACELADGPVRYDDQRDSLSLLLGEPVTAGRTPGSATCARFED